MRKFVVLIFTLVAVSGCEGRSPASPEPGLWRGVIELPGGELPFGLELGDLDGGGVRAYLINGAERVAVDRVTFEDDRLLLELPAFNTRIEARRAGAGLAGELTLVKRGGVEQRMPFRAQPDQAFRFFDGPQDVDADFSGKWRVVFSDDAGKETLAVGEFEQRNGVVTGTFRTPTGDYRYLAGEVRGRDLFLSTFDGAHAFLFTAKMDENGVVNGDFWSGTKWHERWTARRDADVALPDPDTLTRLSGGARAVDFAFPNAAGELVTPSDERFRGKVLIVALAGSWCPNCHDEAAFLAPFYQRYRARGLEVVGLMYEHLDDPDEAWRQIERFRAKFNIEYDLLLAGSSDKAKASATLPMLSSVVAYPTMIVLDRSGEVARIHTGFDGPGTGEHYQKFRREFSTFIESLLSAQESG